MTTTLHPDISNVLPPATLSRRGLRHHVIDLVALQSHMLQRDEVFCLPATAREQPCIAH